MDEKYLDSQFWRLPEAYNIQELLDEQAQDEPKWHPINILIFYLTLSIYLN